MDWKLPFAPAFGRLIVVTGLLATVLTWLADIAVVTGQTAPSAQAVLWLPVLVTGPLAALAMPDTRWSPPLLKRVVLTVVMSLALTVWTFIAPPEGFAWWGVLETVSLLFLVIRTVGQVERPATAVISTTVLAVTVLLLPLRTGSWSSFWPGGYVLTLALAVCVTLGCAIRAAEARRARTALDVRRTERLVLARDLHDLIAHHVTGIIVQANAALTVHTTAPDKVEPILRNISEAGTETLESMRRLVHVLREDNHTAVRPGDLLTELGQLVSAHTSSDTSGTSADPGARVRLDITAAARTAHLSPEVEISVLRTVQEALTNVRRHAPGSRTEVRLDADADWLRVTVTNSAPPRSASAPAGRGGFGLLGLRERIEALDGTLRTGSTPDGGWHIAAAFPLPPRSAPPAEASRRTGL